LCLPLLPASHLLEVEITRNLLHPRVTDRERLLRTQTRGAVVEGQNLTVDFP
jgi:hypothetical protein